MVQTEDDRKARLQYELRRRGIQQKTIAEQAGVSEATVSKVFAGTYPAATDEGRQTRDRVEQLTAAAIGLPIEELFAREAA